MFFVLCFLLIMFYLSYNTVLVGRSFSGILTFNELDLAKTGTKKNGGKKNPHS